MNVSFTSKKKKHKLKKAQFSSIIANTSSNLMKVPFGINANMDLDHTASSDQNQWL